MRAFNEGITIHNTLLEIRSSLKPAFDASFGDCACGVLLGLCEMIDTKTKGQFAKELTQWKSLLEPLVVDEEVQIDMIYDLQEYCEKKGKVTQQLCIASIIISFHAG